MAKKTKPLPVIPVSPLDVEQELMREVVNANPEKAQQAFAQLFNRYKDKMMGFCINMVKNKSVAEELGHEVFLKVYRYKEKYDPQYKFSTWLWTIARNTCLDYLKKKKDYSLNDMYSGEDGSGNYEEKLIDDKASAEEQLISKATTDMIQNCLDNMKGSQKEAITMRVFSELGHKEIAQQLELSESAVKSLINRAKISLVNCVKSCMGEECASESSSESSSKSSSGVKNE
jgi:RNA polymerase sigma-70 factor, ECF subfamily